MEGVRYCCPMFGVSRQIFVEAPQYQNSRKCVRWKSGSYMRAGGRTWRSYSHSTLQIQKRLNRASLNGLTSSATRSCKFNNQDITISPKLKFVAAFERIWPSHLKHTRLKWWRLSAKQNGTMSSFPPSDFSTTVLVLSFIMHIQSCINIQPCGAPQVTSE